LKHFRNLLIHIESQSHRSSFSNIKFKGKTNADLNQAITYLKKLKFRQKPENKQNDSEFESKEMPDAPNNFNLFTKNARSDPNSVRLDIFSGLTCDPKTYFRFEITNFILKHGLPLVYLTNWED